MSVFSKSQQPFQQHVNLPPYINSLLSMLDYNKHENIAAKIISTNKNEYNKSILSSTISTLRYTVKSFEKQFPRIYLF